MQLISTESDPTQIVNLFTDNVNSIYNDIAPYKTVLLKRPSTPWITNESKLMYKQRDKLYKKAKRLESSTLLLEFRSLRRQIKEKIQAAQNNFLRQNLQNLNDSISIWRFLGKPGLT